MSHSPSLLQNLKHNLNDLCFWHWGNMGIFYSFVFGNPVTGNATVIFTNDLRGLPICERTLLEINGHHLASFMWL